MFINTHENSLKRQPLLECIPFTYDMMMFLMFMNGNDGNERDMMMLGGGGELCWEFQMKVDSNVS